MMIAQQLYEGIDLGKEGTVRFNYVYENRFNTISDSAQNEAVEYIDEEYGKEYVRKQRKAKTIITNVQDAHEAIRPTSVLRTPSFCKRCIYLVINTDYIS